jgi:hypothetical protein
VVLQRHQGLVADDDFARSASSLARDRELVKLTGWTAGAVSDQAQSSAPWRRLVFRIRTSVVVPCSHRGKNHGCRSVAAFHSEKPGRREKVRCEPFCPWRRFPSTKGESMALMNLTYHDLGGADLYSSSVAFFGGARAAQWPNGVGLRRVVRGRQADSGR